MWTQRIINRHTARRRRWRFFGAIALLWMACAACTSVSSAGPADRISPENVLASAIELKEGQDGFAGTSGQVWRVEPNGAYTVARFLNSDEQAPHLSGQLTSAQVATLAAALREADLPTLPGNLGKGSTVNPQTTALRYRGKVVILTTPPGEAGSGPAAGARPAEEQRFLRLVTIVKSQLGIGSR
jgi:hypothetical protein